MSKKVFAIGCHPDDIELLMSGTLFLLRKKGYEVHYMNIANGSCGSLEHDAPTAIRIRRGEAMEAASILGAVFHESLTNDLEVFYELGLLRKLTSVIRAVEPDIVLTHYPFDYMEDHSNTCRLAVSATFCRNMPNFAVEPPVKAIMKDVVLYHCLPAGLLDPLKREVIPEIFVDVSKVMGDRIKMLSAHKSQKDWLDKSQGFDSYIKTMEEWSEKIGKMSGRHQFSEGWIRHLPNGLCCSNDDPLSHLLCNK
jgi:N-acetylglucosamine malate deacetylase 1